MAASTPNAPTEIEGTDYELEIDYREVDYFAEHDDGRTTQVNIQRPFFAHRVTVTEVKGDQEANVFLGPHDSRQAALETAREWMQNNPEGVRPGFTTGQ